LETHFFFFFFHLQVFFSFLHLDLLRKTPQSTRQVRFFQRHISLFLPVLQDFLFVARHFLLFHSQEHFCFLHLFLLFPAHAEPKQESDHRGDDRGGARRPRKE
jgi:hypothetical protein